MRKIGFRSGLIERPRLLFSLSLPSRSPLNKFAMFRDPLREVVSTEFFKLVAIFFGSTLHVLGIRIAVAVGKADSAPRSRHRKVNSDQIFDRVRLPERHVLRQSPPQYAKRGFGE